MRTRLPVSGCALLSAVCFTSFASAQTNWARRYGRLGNDVGFSVQQTIDGGYIVTGLTGDSFSAMHDSVYLIKTDAQGDTLWTRAYRGSQGKAVQQTIDGGYIIACSGGNTDLVKTDASGNTLWTSAFGNPARVHYSNSVQQTSDSGYAMTGPYYLVKTNAEGESLWARVYGGAYDGVCHAMRQTTDGGYIVAGAITADSGLSDVYLLKTDARGDSLWTRTYGVAGHDEANSVQQTADGGYIIIGSTWYRDSGNIYGDVYLIKTDAQGDTAWTRVYGGALDEQGFSVQQTADGGYIIVGHTASFGANTTDNVYDFWLLKTDAQGDTLWTRTCGGKGHDDAYSVSQTTGGGYIIAGYTAPFEVHVRDVLLVKSNGELDVGPVAILPPETVEVGHAYVPRAAVRNLGLTSGICQVTLEIGSWYTKAVQETLTSVPLDTVVFPPWTAGPVGSVPVTCFTSLVGDMVPANDTFRDAIQVVPQPPQDVGAVAIVSPTGSVRAGDTVIPRARIRNFGNRVERFFDVRFRIGTIYNEKVNVADALPAGSTAELAFPPWVAEAGDWAVSCSTMLGSDENRDNDKVSSSIQVTEQTLTIEPDQSDRIEAGKSKTYNFYALIQGDTGAVVEVTRPSAPPGWSLRLGNATGADDLTDTDGDGVPDLGYVAQGESSWFSLDVTAPSGTQGDTASLSQVTIPLAGYVGGRLDIADTAVLTLALMPELSIHNFPNPFTDHTTFVVGLPEDGKASLAVYTRTGERVCRILTNADMTAGVHVVRWDGVNDNGRSITPGTYEYLLDYVHAGKTDHVRKKLVLTRQ